MHKFLSGIKGVFSPAGIAALALTVVVIAWLQKRGTLDAIGKKIPF